MSNLDARDVWDRLLQVIGQEVKEEELDLWLRPAEPVQIADHLLHLRVPNKFFSTWIKDHYQRRMETVLKDISGQDLTLQFEVAKNIDSVINQEKRRADPIEEALPQSEFPLSELNPRYTFSTFVVGPSNRFAHATAEAIAKNPGRQYNPFFIYGPAGLGKTHLLHGIGHAIRMVLSGVFDKHPRLKVVLGHLGETLPFLVWRIDHAIARPGAAKKISFRDIFCNNFWITTSGNFSNPALMCCVQEMGVDRILFAVDWPFVMNPPGVEWMATVPLCDEDKAKILSGNARRLLRL